MLVLKCDQPVFFDVDDTLVMWDCANSLNEQTIPVECGGITQYLRPHKIHIEQLKAHAARKHTIIVWSQGGHEWAEAVVKSLELEKFVDLVIQKPVWYYDDLKCEDFMGKPIYFKE